MLSNVRELELPAARLALFLFLTPSGLLDHLCHGGKTIHDDLLQNPDQVASQPGERNGIPYLENDKDLSSEIIDYFIFQITFHSNSGRSPAKSLKVFQQAMRPAPHF